MLKYKQQLELLVKDISGPVEVFRGLSDILSSTTSTNKGGSQISRKGDEAMTVYGALSLMLASGMFVVAVLSFHKRK